METEVITDWGYLFSEIAWSYEKDYPPVLWKTSKGKRITFNKLTICEEGQMEYKGHTTEFDPKLWPKVMLIYRTFEEGGVVDTLW